MGQFMAQNKPFIAICFASYNGEQYIEEQLESIFAQNYQNFKLYIADDRSTDNTVMIIKTFQDRFRDRIYLTVNHRQLGVVKNFETLLSNCKEEYIALSDQDDIWKPNKLARQLEVMLQLEKEYTATACLVHSDLILIDKNVKVLNNSYFGFRGYKLNQKKDLGHILGPSGVMGNTLMINRKLCDKSLPFPKELEVHDYWIGIVAELYGKRKTLQEPLVLYRVHNMNISNSIQNIQAYTKKWQWNVRNLKLPYLDSKRHYIMSNLLKKVLENEDKKAIQAFYDYLTFSKSRLEMYLDLIRYSLVKRGLWFRIKLFVKLMLTERYTRK